MTREDALEFIDCHGGDPARWPDAERGVVLALVAVDADVAAALPAARRLDALVTGWATATPAAAFDLATITGLAQEKPPAVQQGGWPLRWIGGGALAAAVVAGLVILAPVQPATDIATVSTPSPVLSATAEGNGDLGDAEAFASVFTPTADEEDLI